MTKPKPIEETKEGPSMSFLMRTRNPLLASPQRFEPTRKEPGDVVI